MVQQAIPPLGLEVCYLLYSVYGFPSVSDVLATIWIDPQGGKHWFYFSKHLVDNNYHLAVQHTNGSNGTHFTYLPAPPRILGKHWFFFSKYLVDNNNHLPVWHNNSMVSTYYGAASHATSGIGSMLFAWFSVWFPSVSDVLQLEIDPQGGMFSWIISWNFDLTMECFGTYSETSISRTSR